MQPQSADQTRRPTPAKLTARTIVAAALMLALALGRGAFAQSQTNPSSSATENGAPDYSETRGIFPFSLRQYTKTPVPVPDLKNSGIVTELLEQGRINLSLPQMLRAVIENNLDLSRYRQTLSLAQADVLRAKAGQVPKGTEAARIPSGLGTLAGGAAGAGNAVTTARSVNISPRGAFDPTFTLNISQDALTTPQNNTRRSGVTTVTTHATAFQARYAQAFQTGTSFSFSFNTLRQSTTSRNNRFNPALTSNFNLSVNQQLLSGFGLASNRRFIKIAQTNEEIAREYLRQQAITILSNAQNQYWDYVAARERVVAAQKALETSERLLSDNRKQAQIGTLAPLDVVSAEAEVAARRRDLIVAQTSEQVQELQLKNSIARDLNETLASAQLIPSDPLPQPKDSDIPPFEDALAAAMRNRPEITQLEKTVQNQDVAVKFAGSRLKPTLSIFGVLSSQGNTGGLTTTWSDVWALNFPEYAYGFSLTVPIGNRAAQADNLRARLERQQSETSLQRTRRQIQLEVRNAIIGLQQARAQIEAAAKAVELSQQTVDAEQRKLQAGTSIPYNVIRVERDLLNAQLALVQAQVVYAKALVEMDRSTGRTLEAHNLTVEQIISSASAAAPTVAEASTASSLVASR